MVMARQRRLLRGFTANERDAVRAELQQVESEAAGEEREQLLALASIARPDALDRIIELGERKNWRGTPLQRFKRMAINTSGAPTVLLTGEENGVDPFPEGQPQQPASEALIISEIELFAPQTLLPATYKTLIEEVGLRIHYPDGRHTLDYPLHQVLRTRIQTPDAGVDNASAGSEAALAGTQTLIHGRQAVITLQGRDRLGVLPGDSQVKLSLFRYKHAPGTALSGEGSVINLFVTFNGMRYASGKDES